MPWNETSVVDQRVQFIRAWQKDEASMAALCRAFGITRPTGYKWVSRFRDEAEEGCVSVLADRSRRPLHTPHKVSDATEDVLIRARKRWPTWGPRKLKSWLEGQGVVDLPAPSTIGEILKRNGLVERRRTRRHTPPFERPFAAATAPNAIWCVDFKGHFRTRDGERCYPLTVMDAFSRFLIRCEGVRDPDGDAVRPIFESAFTEFGLPSSIRSDNGPPFASTAAGGLTPLSVWWIELGIVPERIEPGKPQQNGRHERMHRTLKAETAKPPAATFTAQQRTFDRFRKTYNFERPHEALEQQAPSTAYTRSSRTYPHVPRDPRRLDCDQLLVDRNGEVELGRGKVFINKALAYRLLNCFPAGGDLWEVTFGPIVLGLVDRRRSSKGLIRPRRRNQLDLDRYFPF